jgi:threonine aldolase
MAFALEVSMSRLARRSFLKCAAVPLAAAAPQTPAASPAPIYLFGDGLNNSPAEYARLLTSIVQQDRFRRDSYLKDGAVQDLETRMAGILGKEKALFLPTGTLANHLAVRVLAGERRKVLVQEESHLYRDESDCAQLLSGLNLVPLGSGHATLTADEVAQAVDRAAGPPYPAPVGAISIESPVRRTMGQAFAIDEMRRISAYARAHGIGAHLDGARMFVASAYTGILPEQYAALFDTVYVSLYKYFNAPFGAILAGPANLVSRMETLRHQFGSAIYQGWESAAVALHYLDGFEQRFQSAARNGEEILRLLESGGKFQVERVPSGTNIAWIRLASGAALDNVRDRLAASAIHLNVAKGASRAIFQVNETLNRRPPDEIATAFRNGA